MPDIFLYTDYRKYLKDFYDEKKALNRSFSYNFLAAKAGLKGKGFLHNVLHGKKNLSKVSVVGLSRALEHNEKQADYFENLVFFNQAEDLKTKSMFFDRLCDARCWNSKQKKIKLLTKDQYEYFSKWYHSAIRSLIDMYPVREHDTEWMSEHVYPKISMLEAQRSIKLLLRRDL